MHLHHYCITSWERRKLKDGVRAMSSQSYIVPEVRHRLVSYRTSPPISELGTLLINAALLLGVLITAGRHDS